MARTSRKRGAAAGPADDPSGPKTTRPQADSRRPPDPPAATDTPERTFDAMPDRIDERDWFYRPGLTALPDMIVNCDHVPTILQQGKEGACTGYALAAVINYLLAGRTSRATVSPRMLYEMARRYDEWPGEDYDGSSARGAMKGWVRHGVTSEGSWPADLTGPDHLTPERAEEARLFPGGAFYRLMHRQVRDVHTALADVGIVYMTLMVHNGWDVPGPATVDVEYYQGGAIRRRTLPVITRAGRADRGHAVAIVGYTAQGFLIQNSWGPEWGAEGFALLPYEDYMLHAVDVWVAQLGVPVALDLWAQNESENADTTAGLGRAAPLVPLTDIRPYVVDVSNEGALSDSGDYWTTERDLERLFSSYLPERTRGWAKRRVMLYLHGGLNDERAVARRVLAYRDVFLANEIYPLHIMWESGAVEVIRGMLESMVKREVAPAAASWLHAVRDGVLEARDLTLELTTAVPGGALWRKMKDNARLSSDRPDGKGGMELLAAYAGRAVGALPAAQRRDWELHVVGHSAGSIYCAYGMPHIANCGIALKSVQLMAPAITNVLFRQSMMPLVAAGSCPAPDVYLLSDVGERDDDVGPYGKSLLYLVSNAFEGRRDAPLTGMARYVRAGDDPAAAALVDAEIAALLAPGMVVAGETRASDGRIMSRSESHGGFDNDADTMNSVLTRILGAAPKRPFMTRDLQF